MNGPRRRQTGMLFDISMTNGMRPREMITMKLNKISKLLVDGMF